jgi:hypothetical protein
MKEFEYQGETKVTGVVTKAFLAAFGPYVKRGEQVLCRRFGVDEIRGDTETWYPLIPFLQAMKEFQDQFGLDFMRKIGQFIFTNAVFPPGIDSVEKGMSSINQAYYMNHQTKPGEIGGYHWKPGQGNQGEMICDNPYPCSFDLGIIETIARHFAAGARVTHDDSKPCRHKGGDSCTYKVEW